MQDLVQVQAVLVLEAPQLHQIPSTPADSAQILEVCPFIQKHRFRSMLGPATAMTFTSDLGLFYIVAFTLRIESLFVVNERNGIISLGGRKTLYKDHSCHGQPRLPYTCP